MRFLKISVLFFALFGSLNACSQQTDLFIALQTGTPFRIINNEGAPVFLNFNFGVEQYIINKLSVALSYRKAFYLAGKDISSREKLIYDYYGWNYAYTEEYDSYSIDFESKYFIDGPADDGAYVASCLSFQHITMNVDVISVLPVSYPTGPQMVPYGKFKDEMNIYPFAVKIGARQSGDVLVFDYFIGIAYLFGAAGIHRINENHLHYFDFKTVSFPIGIKLGFKF